MAMTTEYNDDYNTQPKNLETFALLWLGTAVNTNKENREAQQQLRSTINHVTTFENPNLCQQYIQSLCLQDRLILIVSGRLGREVVPHIHQVQQLSSIYVHCMDKQKNEKWAKNFTKIKAVTDQLDDLISRIKADQKKRMKVEEPIVINIFTVNENPNQSTIGQNDHFVHSLLLIDVLRRMKSLQTDKEDLIKLCKKTYKDNKTELNILREFQNEYSPKEALRWYTRESFLYKMLNKALKVQNIDVLFLFRFFIRDIHQELERNQYQSPVRVYRGQVLSNDELNNLQKSISEFISINSFFSTSTNRHQVLGFLNSCDISDDLHRVLFKIDADPRVVTTKPFADIGFSSEVADKSEVLFMIGSIFRVQNIQRGKENIWIIQLTLCGDNELDSKTLFEHMKKTSGTDNDEVTLFAFAKVLHRMGKFDSAEKFYRRILNELPSDDPSISDLYYSLGLVLKDKKDMDSSLQYLHKSLEIKLQTSPHDYKNISDRYKAIGNIYRKKGHHNVALSWYQKGIELLEQESPADNLKMVPFYNNIAIVYEEQEKYVKALDFNKKALIIREQYLPSNHPDIGQSYKKIGNIHHYLGHYEHALEYYNRSLSTRLTSLPPNHPHVAESYRTIGLVHEDRDEPNQALGYFQKAATIRRHSLPALHPDIVKIEKDIKRVSSTLK